MGFGGPIFETDIEDLTNAGFALEIVGEFDDWFDDVDCFCEAEKKAFCDSSDSIAKLAFTLHTMC